MNGTNTPVRDAAAALLLRDGGDGPEVLMVRRHLGTAFGPGKYVFPGGAVDSADHLPVYERWCRGFDDASASRILGLPRGGLAFWVAAIRECMEEVGLVLTDPDSDVQSAAFQQELPALRRALAKGTVTLTQLFERYGWRLGPNRLTYFSHWVTPPGPPRRFSARFFIGRAPAGQQAIVDGEEIIDHRWLTADAALRLHRKGEIGLMLPTRVQLEWLGRHTTVTAALAAAMAVPVKTVAPESPGAAMRYLERP